MSTEKGGKIESGLYAPKPRSQSSTGQEDGRPNRSTHGDKRDWGQETEMPHSKRSRKRKRSLETSRSPYRYLSRPKVPRTSEPNRRTKGDDKHRIISRPYTRRGNTNRFHWMHSRVKRNAYIRRNRDELKYSRVKEELHGLLLKDSSVIMVNLESFDILRTLDLSKRNPNLLWTLLDVIDEAFLCKPTHAFMTGTIQNLYRTNVLNKILTCASNSDQSTFIQKVNCVLNILMNIFIANGRIQMLEETVEKIRTLLSATGILYWNKDDKRFIYDDRSPMQCDTFLSTAMLLNRLCDRMYHGICTTQTAANVFQRKQMFPTKDDITEDEMCEYLTENKVEGPYASQDEYLQTHFFLMREDVLIPLRKEIRTFQAKALSAERKATSDMHVYTNAKLISTCVNTNKCVSFLLNIKPKNTSKERLKGGSLVVLSADNFATFYCASVTSNKNIRKGSIEIMFENTTYNETNSLFDRPLAVIESATYFEAYRHVLKVLKSYADIPVPFQDILVFCNMNVCHPKYISNETRFVFQLPANLKRITLMPTSDVEMPKCEIDEDSFDATDEESSGSGTDTYTTISRNSEEETFCVDLLGTNWPPASYFELDDSQYKAFRSALTKRFCVIQGPPGCGKTFIGLKIVEAFLNNKQLIDGTANSPIMVTCYTNHALDQFLEGIKDKIPTCKPIRIGGRSQSEKLKEFNLSKLKRTHMQKQRTKIPRHQHENLEHHHTKVGDEQTAEYNTDRSLFCARGKSLSDTFHFKRKINTNTIIQEIIKENIISIRSLSKYIGPLYEQFVWLGIDSDKYHKNITLEWLDLDDVRSPDFEWEEYCKMKATHRGDDIDAHKIACFGENHVALYCGYFHSSTPDSTTTSINQTIQGPHVSTEGIEIGQIYDLRIDERRGLYRYWAQQYAHAIREEMIDTVMSFEDTAKRLNEVNTLIDKQLISQCDVFGLTTTCAARNWDLLNEVRPKIVIIEEAAEVFESHILASLTASCQHLILIGDHKQLKPKPEVYDLGRKYGMDISLFERMVQNEVPYTTLNVQHRMRPEISETIRFIYSELQDSDTVRTYPDIMGLKCNVFWINHCKLEDTLTKNDNSCTNTYEAEYLFALTNYLLLQDFKEADITILTFYTGQVKKIKDTFRKCRNASRLRRVRVDTVDNFQGEENNIILLSLVRANPDGNIGFVKQENRLNVALSRAKMGLYIIGNGSLVRKRKTSPWRSVYQNMQARNMVDNHLALVCQNHPDEVIYANSPKDFELSPRGGCRRLCPETLECGHKCPWQCHFGENDHERVMKECNEPCNRYCKNNEHVCRRKCNERCADKCTVDVQYVPGDCSHVANIKCWQKNNWKCTEPVLTLNERCGHREFVECHLLCEPFQCSSECNLELPCGHLCQKICFEKCDPCMVVIEYQRACGHKGTRQCYQLENFDDCLETIHHEFIPCGHKIQIPCYRKHGSCEEPVSFKRQCGHHAIRNCCTTEDECEPCDQLVEYYRKACGHQDFKRCYEHFEEGTCKQACNSDLDCGHKCNAICGTVGNEYDIRSSERSTCIKGHAVICDQVCNTTLACGHICSASCFNCQKGVYHKTCLKPCGCTLVCGHRCTGTCSSCNMCDKQCRRRCGHEECARTCSEECRPCDEWCKWKCRHVACTLKCGELCDRSRCEENCDRILACNHPCAGMCGDPCPNICFRCHRDILPVDEDLLLPYRFVQLSECGDIVRVDFMDKYMDTTETGVLWKSCPICGVTLRNTNGNRYTRQLNEAWMQAALIKKAARRERNERQTDSNGKTLDMIETSIRECMEVDDLPSISSLFPIQTRQNGYDAERSIQRKLDCQYLKRVLHSLIDTDIEAYERELEAALDILDSPLQYDKTMHADFKTFMERALPGLGNTSHMLSLTFNFVEKRLSVSTDSHMDASGDTGIPSTELCEDSDKDMATFSDGELVITIPLTVTAPYSKRGTSSVIPKLLKEMDLTVEELGISYKDHCRRHSEHKARRRAQTFKGINRIDQYHVSPVRRKRRHSSDREETSTRKRGYDPRNKTDRYPTTREKTGSCSRRGPSFKDTQTGGHSKEKKRRHTETEEYRTQGNNDDTGTVTSKLPPSDLRHKLSSRGNNSKKSVVQKGRANTIDNDVRRSIKVHVPRNSSQVPGNPIVGTAIEDNAIGARGDRVVRVKPRNEPPFKLLPDASITCSQRLPQRSDERVYCEYPTDSRQSLNSKTGRGKEHRGNDREPKSNKVVSHVESESLLPVTSTSTSKLRTDRKINTSWTSRATNVSGTCSKTETRTIQPMENEFL